MKILEELKLQFYFNRIRDEIVEILKRKGMRKEAERYRKWSFS